MSCTSETTEHGRASWCDATYSAEVCRANLFFLLSRGFSSPVSMTHSDPIQLSTLAALLEEPLHSSACTAAHAWSEALKDYDSLARAYARLFLGPFEILAPPYASFYLEPDQQIMGQVS